MDVQRGECVSVHHCPWHTGRVFRGPIQTSIKGSRELGRAGLLVCFWPFLCTLLARENVAGERIERVQSCDLRLPSGGAYASYISPNLAVALAHVNDPFMNVVRPARRPAFYPAFH